MYLSSILNVFFFGCLSAFFVCSLLAVAATTIAAALRTQHSNFSVAVYGLKPIIFSIVRNVVLLSLVYFMKRIFVDNFV